RGWLPGIELPKDLLLAGFDVGHGGVGELGSAPPAWCVVDGGIAGKGSALAEGSVEGFAGATEPVSGEDGDVDGAVLDLGDPTEVDEALHGFPDGLSREAESVGDGALREGVGTARAGRGRRPGVVEEVEDVEASGRHVLDVSEHLAATSDD